MALLAKFNIVQSVWTTNFDNMTLKAAESLGVTTFPISIETKEEIYNNFSRNGLKYVALHGDYKYSKIKNSLLLIFIFSRSPNIPSRFDPQLFLANQMQSGLSKLLHFHHLSRQSDILAEPLEWLPL